jgi:hypothetical protein
LSDYEPAELENLPQWHPLRSFMAHDQPFNFSHAPFLGQIPLNDSNLPPDDPVQVPGPDVDRFLRYLNEPQDDPAIAVLLGQAEEWVQSFLWPDWIALPFWKKKKVARARLEALRRFLNPMSKADLAKFLQKDPEFEDFRIRVKFRVDTVSLTRIIELSRNIRVSA